MKRKAALGFTRPGDPRAPASVAVFAALMIAAAVGCVATSGSVGASVPLEALKGRGNYRCENPTSCTQLVTGPCAAQVSVCSPCPNGTHPCPVNVCSNESTVRNCGEPGPHPCQMQAVNCGSATAGTCQITRVMQNDPNCAGGKRYTCTPNACTATGGPDLACGASTCP